MTNLKIDKDEFDYQLKLSQGKGLLTPRMTVLLIQLCKKTFEVKQDQYSSIEDRKDVYSEGLYQVMKNWQKADLTYGRSGYNYIVEVFKRGTYHSVSNIFKMKHSGKGISLDSITFD